MKSGWPHRPPRGLFTLQAMEPLRVSVRRGEIVEAVHRVHAVAVQDGAVVAEAGDSALVAFMRSSSKPLQAVPLARARDDMDERDLAIASASHLAEDEIPSGVDGCGVITFALPLERMAHSFARLPQLNGGDRVAAAMRSHPDLIRGPLATDTRLMKALPGWIAKGGAEGLLCAAGRDGLGVALKAADGNGRALGPAAAVFLQQFDLDLDDLAVVPLENSRGERVGEVRVQA